MTRPRSAEDLDELHLRARLRLQRRRKAGPPVVFWHGPAAPNLVREASALVAAIDALREENMMRLEYGDR